MKVTVTNLHNQKSQDYEGTPAEIEQSLRIRYRHILSGVPFGDFWLVIEVLARQQAYHVETK